MYDYSKLFLPEVEEDDGGGEGAGDVAGKGDGAARDHEDPGWQFNRIKFGYSFVLKNGLRFHFDSVTCLNYPFFNFFSV